MPAVVIGASADVEPSRLRRGEILPDPDFSRLSPTRPFVIGIRPHREGGVCLKLKDEPIPSRFGPKFVIHNYGHGGAGITLSFGCASVVAEHVQTVMRDMRRSKTRPSVAVIGSGVIGLTVAAELRRKWRKLESSFVLLRSITPMLRVRRASKSAISVTTNGQKASSQK